MTCSKYEFVVLNVGTVRTTHFAREQLNPYDVVHAVHRHRCGDWGDVDQDDWTKNDQALKDGDRVLSSYVDRNQQRFLIITEADRRSTTILLPEDY